MRQSAITTRFRFHGIGAEEVRRNNRGQWRVNSQLNGDIRILEALNIVDVTQNAFNNELIRPVGMRLERMELLIILNCMFFNTALIFGWNGVGKSTIVNSLAFKIIDGRVPESCLNNRVLKMDLSLLIAGASMHGELSKRIKLLFQFLDANPHAILAIDEAHLIVAKDVGMESEFIHLMKQKLNDGKYKLILITDMAHVNLMTEDPALMGRLQPMEIKPPERRNVLRLFKVSLQKELTRHHNMRLPSRLVQRAYELSEELMFYDRVQPARTIKLIDASMSRQRLKNSHNVAITDQVLNEETLLVTARLFSRADQKGLSNTDRIERIKRMPEELKKVFVGHDEIIEDLTGLLVKAIRESPRRPAVLFFQGNSGTGKTALAMEIGKRYSGEFGIERIDCSQLIDKWSITALLGSYPGLIWSDKSSRLSRVRSNPYTTFIFDEIEKADMAIVQICLQIFMTPYRIKDSRNVDLDFSHSLIIFTSNLGHSAGNEKKMGFGAVYGKG